MKTITHGWVPLVLSVGLGTLFGCASTGNFVQGFDQIELAPGDTGRCIESPCRVRLRLPPGDGLLQVIGNGTPLGGYRAGQTADLGSFWESQAFQIQGANLPKAYAYIPNYR